MKRCYPLLFLILLILFLIYPALVLHSAKVALRTWAELVLPALLPFFILNRLCVTYGAIDLIGRLLSPLTRYVLRLPQNTAYAIAMGYSTGAPVSSVTIAKLRQENAISRRVGNYLLPFTSNVSPLFLFSVVAAGFLNRPDLGVSMALIHYGSNFFLGFCCFRFLLRERPPTVAPTASPMKYPPLGKGLYDSVMEGIATITMIGGLMVLFFILIDFLKIFGFFAWLPIPWGEPLLCGGIEITAGMKCTAAMNVSLWSKLPLIAGILAFGGVSALLQIATQIKTCDLSLKIYLRYKLIQGILAGLITYAWPFRESVATLAAPWAKENVYFSPALPLLGYTLIFFISYFILHHRRHRKSKTWRSSCR